MAAPLGNQNATKNKPFLSAVERAIAQGDGQKLRQCAEKLIDKDPFAPNGDREPVTKSPPEEQRTEPPTEVVKPAAKATPKAPEKK